MSKSQIVCSCRDEPMLGALYVHLIRDEPKWLKHSGILIHTIVKVYRVNADADQRALRYKSAVRKRIVHHRLAREVDCPSHQRHTNDVKRGAPKSGPVIR